MRARSLLSAFTRNRPAATESPFAPSSTTLTVSQDISSPFVTHQPAVCHTLLPCAVWKSSNQVSQRRWRQEWRKVIFAVLCKTLWGALRHTIRWWKKTTNTRIVLMQTVDTETQSDSDKVWQMGKSSVQLLASQRCECLVTFHSWGCGERPQKLHVMVARWFDEVLKTGKSNCRQPS